MAESGWGGPRPAWSSGNQVELLPFGAALFPALLQAWARARHRIWLETYIFHDDPQALELAAALVDCARRGVEVRVVVDGFGSARALPTLERMFAGSGVEFRVYRPWRRWSDLLQRGHWRRLHRKLCLVDADLAFIGGINLIDDRHDIQHGWSAQPRLDYAVQVSGPVLRQVQTQMRRLWQRNFPPAATAPFGSAKLRRRLRHTLLDWSVRLAPGRQPASCEPAGVRAALVVRDNLLRRRAIEHSYVAAIDHARSSVVLVCPYFYPGRVFRDSLERAAARGVKVTLMLQGRIDYRSAAWAARALYRELLDAGIEIREYQRAFLHGKVAVIDASWSTIGSSNIDPLSLLVNREANLLVDDSGFASRLLQHLQPHLDAARAISSAGPARHSSWLRDALVALAARLFIALVGATRRY